ncbi:hypothetical protein [Amnibacterium endophyticum]|uniref:Glycosyltransferase RgtA/B/C/D-like domain-containing protein n=1 Tax=Amnibacterium endophyticum TaxID=2109337 RepID=A0ABW4LC19_9MICO
MSLATRARATAAQVHAPRTRSDVLVAVAVGLLLAVHAVIFVATLLLAPVTAVEARSLELLQLPVEAARALMLPFHALLLGCLFVLGRRVAGRWAGFGSMLAVLALDLRADPADVVYGPAVATGGWAAAAVLALVFAVLPRRPRAAAALIGAASGLAWLVVLALPALLVALALRPAASGAARARLLLGATGAWTATAAGMQLIWLARLGAAGWLARADAYLAELRPHALVPWLEQQTIVFGAWHFTPLVTVSLAAFLFLAAGTGAVRYLVVPLPGEQGPAVLRVLRRFPVELTTAFLTMLAFGTWWALSGETVVVEPMLPVLGAVAPLITALAYRGAKWLLTVNRFWALCAVVYLTGLIAARSTQLVITLVQSFRP